MKNLCDNSFRRLAFITTLVVLGVLHFSTHPADAADLRWLPSASPSVVGYKLYAGSESGFYSTGQIDRTIEIGSDYMLNEGVASRSLEDLISGPSWIVLTAYDGTGRESPPSNEKFRDLTATCSSDSDCYDDNACNGEERCIAGACTAGTTLQCEFSDPCNVGRCDPLYGCAFDPVTDGTSCDDGNPWTVGDRCEAGVCYGDTGVPLPSDDSTPTPIYLSFDLFEVGQDPPGWLDTGASNSLAEADWFEIMELSSNDQVFGTRSELTNIHSHLLLEGSSNWSSYEMRGRMRISKASGGIGITLYSDYPDSDTYYRLRRYGSGSFHLSPHSDDPGACVGDTDTGVRPTNHVWYSFRFRAFDADGGTRVQAKVWPEVGEEPTDWQADCLDSSAGRLVAGTPGLWSMGSGEKYWDDLAVLPVQADDEIPPVVAECQVDDDCSDSDACTGVERCVGGSCIADEPLVCPDPGACGVAVCYAFLGCVVEPLDDGTSCGGGDACTAEDTCQEGFCTSGAPLSCPVPGECLVGRCDPASGCETAPMPDGSDCDDGNFDTVQDACSAGVCMGTLPPPPDPYADRPPIGESGRLLFDFEDLAPGESPPGWLDTRDKNSLQPDDHSWVFELADGNHAFGTTSKRTNIHSHYVADNSVGWFDYELRGRMLTESGKAGIGVTIYSDYPDSDSYYRLRHYGRKPFHLANHPGDEAVCEGVTMTSVRPIANTWYTFRLQAFDDQSDTRVRAKVWISDEPEPEDWQIDCLAPAETAYFSGSPGLWSMGRGGKFWDDLEVIGFDGTEEP